MQRHLGRNWRNACSSSGISRKSDKPSNMNCDVSVVRISSRSSTTDSRTTDAPIMTARQWEAHQSNREQRGRQGPPDHQDLEGLTGRSSQRRVKSINRSIRIFIRNAENEHSAGYGTASERLNMVSPLRGPHQPENRKIPTTRLLSSGGGRYIPGPRCSGEPKGVRPLH